MPKRDVATNHRDGLWRDIEERCDVLQREVLHNAWTATHQQFVTLARRSTEEIKIASTSLNKQMIADEKLENDIELCGSFCMGKCQQGVCVTIDKEFFSVSPDSVCRFFDTEVRPRLVK